MIARHDLVLGLTLSVSLFRCRYFLPFLPHLVILCVFLTLSLYLSTSFSPHVESVCPFLCHLFPVFLYLLPQHCLHPFSRSLFCLSATLTVLLSHVCILYFSICLLSTTCYYFSLFSPLPHSLHPFLPLYPSSPCFYSSFTAPRVSQRETLQAVVPAEQLPCKAIQIEMFAENNMCVITA